MSATGRTVVMPLAEEPVRSFSITKEERIEASTEIVFETILEQMGPYNETPDGTSLSMKIEPWPGGRWYRDLGNNTGHMWAHVQAIRPPELLEFFGPMFMSFPATSNVQYRLKADGDATLVRFSHAAMGLIPEDLAANVGTGWANLFRRIREASQRKRRDK